MTTLNLPLDSYDAVIGLDLSFGLNGDLAIDNLDGDLATISGAPAVAEAIRRRITTTPEGYARLVKTSDYYLEPVGVGYGSRAALYLSNPMSGAGLTDDLVNDINSAVLSDIRVQDAQVYVAGASNVEARLDIGLNYRLQPLDTLDSNRVSIGEFSIAGLTIETVNRNQQLIIPIEG